MTKRSSLLGVCAMCFAFSTHADSFNSLYGYTASANARSLITIPSGFSSIPSVIGLLGIRNQFLIADANDDGNPDILEIDNDADGIYDTDELFTYGTNHNDPDTDHDNMPDYWEVSFNLDPLVYDPNTDTDGDGYSDLQEFLNDSDPRRYVLTLNKGWNLISIVRMPSDNSITAIFGNSIAGSVWRWENGRFRTTSEMQPLTGYWVFTPGPGDIEIVLP